MTTTARRLLSQMALEVQVPLRVANPSGLVRSPAFSVDGGPFAPLRQTRYIRGEPVETVLLDSVESQANRQEALLYRHLPLPDVQVELFDGRRVSQYEAPGRILDAIFREATLGGVPFHQTPLFQAIARGGEEAEGALFRHSPLTLVYGGWLSYGDIPPEVAPKWPRLVALEILGLEPREAHRTSSRLDPLGVPGELPLPEAMSQALKEQGKKGRLSEAGLGRIPPTASPMDVAVRGAVLVGAVSLVGLRNLRLPQEAQEALLALALLGLALQHKEGYRLRSGADLVPEEGGCLRVRALPSGEEVCLEVEPLREELDRLLGELPEELRWPGEPVVLQANETLNQLYRNALLGKAERAKAKREKEG
ncbi:type I-U CRISPR-associated protein Cas7 [Thermus thermophilus]|uniref:type I-G CRISPR-associated protein Cas7 n=1 Tax=Thermus thermophilus TaxID=274 RepID=UPI003246F2CD